MRITWQGDRGAIYVRRYSVIVFNNSSGRIRQTPLQLISEIWEKLGERGRTAIDDGGG